MLHLEHKKSAYLKYSQECDKLQKDYVRRPGVEPGSIAWKATMLTVTPPTQLQESAELFTVDLT